MRRIFGREEFLNEPVARVAEASFVGRAELAAGLNVLLLEDEEGRSCSRRGVYVAIDGFEDGSSRLLRQDVAGADCSCATHLCSLLMRYD